MNGLICDQYMEKNTCLKPFNTVSYKAEKKKKNRDNYFTTLVVGEKNNRFSDTEMILKNFMFSFKLQLPLIKCWVDHLQIGVGYRFQITNHPLKSITLHILGNIIRLLLTWLVYHIKLNRIIFYHIDIKIQRENKIYYSLQL